jgi:hypothetical protein
MLQRLGAAILFSFISFAAMAQTSAGNEPPEKAWIKGLLPPDLMRAAVLEDFIPAQR